MWGITVSGIMWTGEEVRPKRVFLALARISTVISICFGLMVSAAQAQVFISKEREKQIGREQHPRALEQFGGAYTERGVDAYVAQIGGLIASYSNDPNVGYTFTVVNSPIVNAFALPGGYVYISRGALAIANSEAELAGVLGHEIGHVTERHMAKRFDREIGVGIIGAVVGAVGGSDVVSQVLQRTGGALIRNFSREQEYEADLVGVRALAEAGYDPYAQADFLDALARERALVAKITGTPYDPNRPDFFSTHPNTGKRVKRAIEEAGKSANGSGKRPRKKDVYLNRIDGILFGDDPDQGFIRGRTFSHPTLRFTFTAPDRFFLQNSTTAVYASGPEKSGLQLTTDRIRSSNDIASYLKDEYAGRRRVTISDIQSFKTQSGLPAATGTYRYRTSAANYNIRFVAIQYSGSQVYNFMFWAPPDVMQKFEPLFHATSMGFRKLSNAEASQLKPLRVRVVTAGNGETVESISSRMAFRKHKIDRFRFINSLDETEGLVAGQRYKIITE